jgi:hypothetical protein
VSLNLIFRLLLIYVIVHSCLFLIMKNADVLVNYIFIYIYNSHIFRLAFVFAFFYVCMENIAH